MGCFSWLFADKNNRKALNIGETGYLLCPNGSAYATEGGYDGYGHFGRGDAFDVYELVADWNREILSKQPDYLVPQYDKTWDEEDQVWAPKGDKTLSEHPWWPFYSDLSLSREEITARMRELTGRRAWEYRFIGIDIACYEGQNAKLPFPIKISSSPDVDYNTLPASEGDPDQGFGRDLYD